MKKHMRLAYITTLFVLLLAIGYALFANYQKANPYTPEFFPLHNTEASYKITKGCPEKVGWEESASSGAMPQNLYCVEYRGDGVLAMNGYENPKFYRIMVGAAQQDLEPFVGKEILIKAGKFVSSGKQCIQNNCTSPQGGSVNLDLDEIVLK